jgi:hypothetical protein
VLAPGSKESSEASASTIRIVAFPTTRAVTAGFISIPIKRISSRGALLEIAGRSTVSLVADTTDVLHGIPGGAVCTISTGSKVFLGPASSTVVTVVRANRTLTSDALVAGEALALTSVAVANTLVGALSPGVEVVGVDHVTNPGKILGTGALRAIGASPLGLTINAGVALAVIVELAGSVAGALVLAHTGAAVASLVPSVLASSSPDFIHERRLTGGHAGRLARRRGGDAGRLARRIAGGAGSRITKGPHKSGEKNNSFDHCVKLRAIWLRSNKLYFD